MQPPRPGSGLALVGYRGTGKSTVGRLLAGTMKRKFLDVDLEIEARAGRSIAAIFCESGEPAFREWEERTMAVLFEQYPEAVVATGGGAVLREANRGGSERSGILCGSRPTPLSWREGSRPTFAGWKAGRR